LILNIICLIIFSGESSHMLWESNKKYWETDYRWYIILKSLPLFPPTVMYFYLQMRGVSLADGNIVCWSTWFQWSSLTPRHGTIPILSCLNFTLLYTRTPTFYNSNADDCSL
jgi:hypothetical protein